MEREGRMWGLVTMLAILMVILLGVVMLRTGPRAGDGEMSVTHLGLMDVVEGEDWVCYVDLVSGRSWCWGR